MDTIPFRLEAEASRSRRRSHSAERPIACDQLHRAGLYVVDVSAYSRGQRDSEHSMPVRLHLFPEAGLSRAIATFD